jgi:UDP-N-acetyl-2-amino-2-deoxyglucuronate dehydrogenase
LINKKFALIGAAGYIAPKHMQAIKETGNDLLAAYDPNDSVGVLDNYFPKASFFTEFERFDRHLEKLKRNGQKVDFISICSPNYLHDAHIRFGLRYGADVICEKPVVLNPHNIDPLIDLSRETNSNIYSILQLRLHPAIIECKKRIEQSSEDKIYDVELTYITPRGNWYYTSWKGDLTKSGGIATNIGIHFFDILSWIFGEVKENIVHLNTHDRAAGFFMFRKARVKWFMSINEETKPVEDSYKGHAYRSLKIDNDLIEFSEGFKDLHIASYKAILEGKGYTIDDACKAIHIVHQIRNSQVEKINEDCHPLTVLPLAKHPFENIN